MRCVLNALQDHFRYVGLEPKPIDAELFNFYVRETGAQHGLFGPVAVTFIANLAVERGDFRPYMYYLKDDFHDLTTLCAGATDEEVWYVQPELFDYPFIPYGEPCIACDLRSLHAFFTKSLSPDNSAIVTAVQIVRIK